MTDYETVMEQIGISGIIEIKGYVEGYHKQNWIDEESKTIETGLIELFPSSKLYIDEKTVEVKGRSLISFWESFPENVKKNDEVCFKGILASISTNQYVELGNIDSVGIVVIKKEELKAGG
jgi:hypothetical protein